jgi:ABC-type Mn2+/Zn2+ transport system permease subunit/Mn-dependent DtxR family transcriptional regulator
MIELFNEAYEIRALLAASLVGVTCGLLGCFIVLRNMALIGDAISHAILPGVVIGFVLAGYNVLAFFGGAVAAGFVTAVLITWLQRNVKTKEDSAIGIIFTVMFALGVMGISLVNRKGVHLDLKDFLFGTILGVSDQDLWLSGVIGLFVVFCVIVFYRYFFMTTFQPVIARTLGISARTMHYFLMLLLSFTIVASLQSVGVILVVAMLIIPASTAYLLTNRLRTMLVISAGVGLASAVIGLIAAILLNTTPGPAMTVMAGIIYGMTIVLAPEKGLLVNALRRTKRRRKIMQEDVLKQLFKLDEKDPVVLAALKARLAVGRGKLQRALGALRGHKLIVHSNGTVQLTKAGQIAALKLIRAHRLWETYLAERFNLTPEQIHEQAEKYEHLLPEQLLDEIDAKLGHPEKDPHGSPIPKAP